MHQLSDTTGTLNSWKEIASYMGRGVRTVQRWELELRLPVHRITASDRSPVFAYKAELNSWLLHRLQRRAGNVCVVASTPVESPPRLTAQVVQNHSKTLERVAQLTNKMMRLLEEQQLRTRVLATHVARMVHLLPTTGKVSLAPPSWQTAAASPDQMTADRNQ